MVEQGSAGKLARLTRLLIVSAGLFIAGGSTLHAQEITPQRTWVDSLEAWGHYLLRHMTEYAPQEMRAELRARNEVHRKGYTAIFADVDSRDALGALFSYFHTRVTLEFGLHHEEYWAIPPTQVMGVTIPGLAFPDSMAYPADPWKRDWWSNDRPARGRRR